MYLSWKKIYVIQFFIKIQDSTQNIIWNIKYQVENGLGDLFCLLSPLTGSFTPQISIN